MARPTKTLFGGVMVLLAFFVLQVQSAASNFAIAYCSPDNTATESARFWTWQSNGWCHDQCVGTSAFAVVLDLNCWCTDYIPADQTDTGDCNVDCPGFPSEKCGNKDKNLFGYIALDKKPSGTQSGSQPSATKSPSAAPPSPVPSSAVETSQAPETIIKTVTQSASVVTLSPTPSTPSSARGTTLKTTPSSAAPTATNDPTPVTDVQTKTISGVVVTMTVVTTTSPSPALTHKSSSSNIGAIVGGVIGGLLFLALLGLAIFFFLRRRKQMEEGGQRSGVQRNTSTMSRNGLLAGEKLPPIVTNMKRASRYGLDHDSVSPISGSDRRLSRLNVYDQRLNPSAMMTLDNVSRASVISLDDGRDYGRTLNVTNPDPEPPEPTHNRS